MKRSVFQIGFLLILGSLLTAIYSQAGSGGLWNSSDQPIDITANKFTARNVDEGVEAIFEGNVQVRQADMTLVCDRLVCFFEVRDHGINKRDNRRKKPRVDLAAKRDVKSITAVGNVRFDQRDRRVTAGKGVYEHAKGTITLTEGPPHFKIGPNVGEAESVIIHVDNDSIEFKSPKFIIIPEAR